jgi:hypothetical protein
MSRFQIDYHHRPVCAMHKRCVLPTARRVIDWDINDGTVPPEDVMALLVYTEALHYLALLGHI